MISSAYLYERWDHINSVFLEEKLQEIHKMLNDYYFDGELTQAKISVTIFCDSDVLGMYNNSENEIIINQRFVAHLFRLETTLENLVCLMLHEMIHQYIWESKIDYPYHGGVFQKMLDQIGMNIKGDYGFLKNKDILKQIDFDKDYFVYDWN